MNALKKYGSPIWNIKSNGKGSITIEFNLKVNKGNFKAVFITPDNRVIKILEQSERCIKTGLLNSIPCPAVNHYR